MDWSLSYPTFIDPNNTSVEGPQSLIKDVTIADIGCGFGGLLVALGPKLPDQLLIGTMFMLCSFRLYD